MEVALNPRGLLSKSSFAGIRAKGGALLLPHNKIQQNTSSHSCSVPDFLALLSVVASVKKCLAEFLYLFLFIILSILLGNEA